jgi:hypothetical protein
MKCVCCGIELNDTPQEVLEENLQKDFPGFNPEDCDPVCDICYQQAKMLLKLLQVNLQSNTMEN